MTHDPLVTRGYIEVLKLATPDEVRFLSATALRVNGILKEYLAARGLLLVDFKLEFGKDSAGRILLADEISPDTCRFWDAQTREKLDKDRFRRDLGGVEDAYAEVLKRLTS